jgi:hypothetical protein
MKKTKGKISPDTVPLTQFPSGEVSQRQAKDNFLSRVTNLEDFSNTKMAIL